MVMVPEVALMQAAPKHQLYVGEVAVMRASPKPQLYVSEVALMRAGFATKQNLALAVATARFCYIDIKQ